MRNFKVNSDVLFWAKLNSERAGIKGKGIVLVTVIDVVHPTDADFAIERKACTDVAEHPVTVLTIETDVVEIH